MRVLTINIDKMTFGGSGLGYSDGKVCFVPYSAPGDIVRIMVKTEKRSYLEGEIIEILEPSPHRTAPVCPVFSVCGGCNWQHLPYATQLAEKQNIFADIVWRSGRIDSRLVLPIIPAPSPLGYRSRVQLKVHSVAGEIHLGFFKAGSHFVVDVPGKCAIADSTINQLIPELERIVRLFPEPDKVPQIDISCGGTGTASVIFHYIGGNLDETAAFLHEFRDSLPSSVGLFIQSGRKMTLRHIDGPLNLDYPVLSGTDPASQEFRLMFTPGGFSQVNYRQNSALVATVRDWCELTGSERLLDIYCGNGNFSIPLAAGCKEVDGIEEYEPSIKDARYNSRANGLENCRFSSADALKGIKDCLDSKDSFDIVLLDPPRTGAAGIAHLIPSLKPEKIIYISCDPPTLARDIGILKGHGYGVVKSQPIDMFPQTFHIESVTLLVPEDTTIRS